MDRISVSQLEPGSALDRTLYHSSGELLLGTGRMLHETVLKLFAESGIEEVLSPSTGEDPGEFVHEARNLIIRIEDMNVGQRLTQPVFDRGGTLLAEAGSVVTERIAESLKRRGIHKIYVRKSTKDLTLEQVQAFRRGLRRLNAKRPEPIREEIDTSRMIKPEDCTPENIDRMIEAGGEVMVPRRGTPLLESLKRHDPLVGRSEESKDGILAMYESAILNTEQIFRALSKDEAVSEEAVGNLSRKVVGGLVEDRDLLLNLQNLKTEQNYLLGHSLGVTVLSISVAAALGYNRKFVLEMGHSAYLHDVGMLKVPEDIISKPGKLTSMEMMQVRRHPIYGLDMLQRLVGHRSGLAGSIPIVAYQSHERTNGTGYPKHRKGAVIHDFAKIVGVCDAYEAMTSKRSWREPMLPYKAMEQLVVGASRGEHASDLVKALLHCVSLFPIGSWVELSDGGLAKVVSSVEQNYTRPVVSVVFRNKQPLDEPERINLAEETSVNVVRPVPEPSEAGDLMEGF